MKKWVFLSELKKSQLTSKEIIQILLKNRGIASKKEIEQFLHPPDPYLLTAKDVGISVTELTKALSRIKQAADAHETVVVYADYDADGITAGTIMWETLHNLGLQVFPYIPHRVEEGYGFSIKGIDAIQQKYNPQLIISVDHGITAAENIAYARTKGVDIIVTDHHVKPDKLPQCPVVHTTELCGAGVAWFLAFSLLKNTDLFTQTYRQELLALVTIGTVADMVPLTGASRSIVKYGILALNETKRVGLQALIHDAGLETGTIGTYEISHILAPRLNAMGRLVHGLDALRLLCTRQKEKAEELAHKLGLTNHERQIMTEETVLHAKDLVAAELTNGKKKKLLFVSHDEYNLGVIGLVAGKLVEMYYVPAIVVARGEQVSKASARSISGFNIIEAIRSCSELLIDAGGHPMAAGFTIATEQLSLLQQKLETFAAAKLTPELLERTLKIDLELPLETVTFDLVTTIQTLAPFGIGNTEPVFVTRNLEILETRLVGRDRKHLKLRLRPVGSLQRLTAIESIGFNMGDLYEKIPAGTNVDVAYTVENNVWNGQESLQLKLKDLKLHA